MCRSGDGSSYRGDVSKSTYGRRCLNWNRFYNPWGSSTGIGNHNYCRYTLKHQSGTYILGRGVMCLILFYMTPRNPDQSLMPWCRVQRGMRNVKEFCYIPRCKPHVGNLKKSLTHCMFHLEFTNNAVSAPTQVPQQQ